MTVSNNGYFKFTDERVSAINGVPLHASWWSRPYEYHFAMQFMEKGDMVADMGCGWMGRPLTAELARNCKEVFGIDLDGRLMDLKKELPNLYYYVANFCNDEMDFFKTSTFDKIYCISVIEDLSPDDRVNALKNFRRLIKPDGKIILTVDTAWESFRYSKPYPALNVRHLVRDAVHAGLRFVGKLNLEMPANPVHQPTWNLACYHCVLERDD